MAANYKSSKFEGVLGLMLGLAWIFFSLRIYVKTFITKSFRVDDLLLIVSIIFFTTFCTCEALAIKYGIGRQITDTSLDRTAYFTILSELFYVLTTVFVRLSIAVFLVRICTERVYKIIINTTVMIVIALSTFYFFFVLFQCSPVDYFWKYYNSEHGHCISLSLRDATIAHSVVSFTADWIFGLLPIAFCWGLQIGQRTKISLISILALGLLAGLATMIRIPYLLLPPDGSVYLADIGLWCTIEAGLGIFAASAFALRPLFRSLLSDSASRTPAHDSTNKESAGGTGYMRNKASPPLRTGSTSREASGQNLGVPLSVDQDVCKIFSDSNEHVIRPNTGGSQKWKPGWERGSNQVHWTFEITSGDDSSIEHDRQWQTSATSGSSVSMV